MDSVRLRGAVRAGTAKPSSSRCPICSDTVSSARNLNNLTDHDRGQAIAVLERRLLSLAPFTLPLELKLVSTAKRLELARPLLVTGALLTQLCKAARVRF